MVPPHPGYGWRRVVPPRPGYGKLPEVVPAPQLVPPQKRKVDDDAESVSSYEWVELEEADPEWTGKPHRPQPPKWAPPLEMRVQQKMDQKLKRQRRHLEHLSDRLIGG